MESDLVQGEVNHLRLSFSNSNGEYRGSVTHIARLEILGVECRLIRIDPLFYDLRVLPSIVFLGALLWGESLFPFFVASSFPSDGCETFLGYRGSSNACRLGVTHFLGRLVRGSSVGGQCRGGERRPGRAAFVVRNGGWFGYSILVDHDGSIGNWFWITRLWVTFPPNLIFQIHATRPAFLIDYALSSPPFSPDGRHLVRHGQNSASG